MKRMALVLVVLLCIGLLIGAVGCGDEESSDSGGSGSPEQVVKDFWNAFKKGDFEKAATYLTEDIADTAFGDMEDLDDPATAAMMDAFLGMMDLEVKGSTVDGDKATVEVELTMPDMETVMDEIVTAMFEDLNEEEMANMTEEQMAEAMAEALPKLMEDAPVITEEDEIPLIKEDGKWKISASPFEDLGGGL